MQTLGQVNLKYALVQEQVHKKLIELFNFF